VRPPWDPGRLFDRPERFGDRKAAIEAMRAMDAAGDALPDVNEVLFWDLQTDAATRYVGMPVRQHVHGQDCNRA
jgi:hypothetical protein